MPKYFLFYKIFSKKIYRNKFFKTFFDVTLIFFMVSSKTFKNSRFSNFQKYFHFSKMDKNKCPKMTFQK